MNAKAKALGMTHTRFVEPTGLSIHNVSTARDLTKLLIATKQYPLIGQLSTTREDMATFSHPAYTLPFRNTNHLVYRDNWNIQLTKTGFTNAAGHCTVMRTVINNKPVALVVMDAFGKYTHFADASRLRTWIETGKVMPVPAAALSYKSKSRANGGSQRQCRSANRTERLSRRRPAGIAPPGFTVNRTVLMRFVGRIFLPEFPLTRFADTGVHTVGRVILPIKTRQRFRRFIQMSNVVLRRVLCPARLQQLEHLRFQRMDVDAFLHDIVLMKNVAHKVTVIEFMYQLAVDFRRQMLEPVGIVAAQGDIQRRDIFHFISVYGLITNRCASSGEAVQEGFAAFFRRTGEETALSGFKNSFSQRCASATPSPAIFNSR